MKRLSLVWIVLSVLMVAALFAGCNNDAAPTDTEDVSDSGDTVDSGNTTPGDTVDSGDTAQVQGPLAGKRIGVAHITLYDEWCKGVYDEFMSIGEEYGVAEVNVQNGDLNAETQQKQVEDFINQKYDVIFIDPVSPDGIQATLDKANEAGIPVIAFDSGTEWEPLVSHVAWDHAETGVLTGEYTANYVKENLGGKVRVGILAMLDAPHTAIRSEKFKETLEAELGAENIEYVFEQDFGQTRESATNIVTNNIAKGIDIIWAAVDNAAFGAKIALEAAGNTETKIVCSGAWGTEPFTTLNDKDPNYMVCIGVSPEAIVRLSMETAAKYFEGDTNIPREQNITLSVIDQNNIGDFMKYVKE